MFCLLASPVTGPGWPLAPSQVPSHAQGRREADHTERAGLLVWVPLAHMWTTLRQQACASRAVPVTGQTEYMSHGHLREEMGGQTVRYKLPSRVCA